ncbi:EF-hand domain pair [Pseudoxanthomonas sp. GM95]|uniref:EF-hand domain-containing protein n=1 Tax=Pseudoxanthomonas sp. GM95 TaxID=1881043 RepID=UPI0008BE5DC0|nr:EF-hand domain-containing protein [Pseudoxanthomonas sp. GM95]SEM45728.1 EF-hand domain pair [Pseudoxanthomonas sp. GM95]
MCRTAVLLLLLCSGPAFAATDDSPATTVQRILERMDRNVDGSVSFEECRNTLMRHFVLADVNHDGTLQADEIPPEWTATGQLTLKNGALPLKDFADSLRPTFDSFDTNHDGQLDTDELTAFANAHPMHLEAMP